MLGVGVDLELQDPVAVEEVCKDRGKRVIFARQRGEEVMNAFVTFASRKVTDVKFRVGGNDNGPCDCATAVFGEEVDENLASRRSSASNLWPTLDIQKGTLNCLLVVYDEYLKDL